MKAKEKTIGLKILKHILALCLCAVMCGSAAFAEQAVELATGKYEDSLYYECTLPDGRLLLIGGKEEQEAGSTVQKVWLMCLNPDLTVSWERVEPDEGDCWIPYAAVLEDGTIAVAYRTTRGGKDRIAAKFFTQDGEPAGKETVIPTEGESLWVQDATPASLMLEKQVYTDDREDPRSEMEVWDWDGTLIARYSPEDMYNGFFYKYDMEDGVLLCGEDPEKRAKIMKKDSLQGTVLWENVLEHKLPETEEAILFNVLRTEDGGYIAFVMEYVIEPYSRTLILVKFDAEGRAQWMKPEDAESGEQYHSITVYDGKIVLYTGLKDHPEAVQTFRWLDPDGNEAGITELALTPEDFPGLPQDDGGTKNLIVSSLQMVPTEDGLLAVVNGRLQEGPDLDEDDEFIHDYIMVRVPEP